MFFRGIERDQWQIAEGVERECFQSFNKLVRHTFEVLLVSRGLLECFCFRIFVYLEHLVMDFMKII